MRFIRYPLGMAVHCAAVPLKLISPILGGALITAGAGIVNSIIGSSSQKSSNKDYLKGVRETNEANKQLYREQVMNNRQDAVMENAYNTPAQQLARLRAAGVNSSDAVSNGNGVQVQSASPPAMQAPEQSPNPFGDMNLGGIAKDTIAAYQSGQQISDTQMSLYQHGIDSAMYYEKQYLAVKGQILDLMSKGIQNDTQREQLKTLTFQAEHLKDEYDAHMRQLNDEHYRSQAQVNVFDNQVKQIQSQIAVEEFRSKTERMLAHANVRRIDADINNIWLDNLRKTAEENRKQTDWELFNQDVRPLEKYIRGLDAKEKEYAASIIMNEAIQRGWDTSSWFNEWMHRIFGFNLPDLIHGSFSFSSSSGTINK